MKTRKRGRMWWSVHERLPLGNAAKNPKGSMPGKELGPFPEGEH
jgi:hypothetical protein